MIFMSRSCHRAVVSSCDIQPGRSLCKKGSTACNIPERIGGVTQLDYLDRVMKYSSPLSVEGTSPKNSNVSKQRLVSLDIFRGLTIALMILVDDAGKAFRSINHAPWFGVTLADFVMPFFLFGNVSERLAATKKVVLRSVKLFMLGVLLQGGYFHGHDNLTYGVDVTKIRVMVVLHVSCHAFRCVVIVVVHSLGIEGLQLDIFWLVRNHHN
ncbi:hypothetical protein OROMI_006764 [Orobanche minor]